MSGIAFNCVVHAHQILAQFALNSIVLFPKAGVPKYIVNINFRKVSGILRVHRVQKHRVHRKESRLDARVSFLLPSLKTLLPYQRKIFNGLTFVTFIAPRNICMEKCAEKFIKLYSL